MQSSKREYHRHERQFSVQVATQERVYQTTSLDLSLGGIQLRECPPLASQQPVKLFVTLRAHLYAGKKLLLLNAIPVWQNKTTIGLRFVDIPPDVHSALATAGLD